MRISECILELLTVLLSVIRRLIEVILLLFDLVIDDFLLLVSGLHVIVVLKLL